MEWQPIGTLPDDGEAYDLWHESGVRYFDYMGADVAHWCGLPLSEFTHWIEITPPEVPEQLTDPHHLAHE